MNERDKKLQEEFPKILKNLGGDSRKTCMSWEHGGIAVGDGWIPLLERLMAFCQFHTDKNYYPQVVADQIKEKFGTLRFYYHFEDNPEHAEFAKRVHKPEYAIREPEMLRGAISFAESMSSMICEDCGKPGEVHGNRWLKCACPECSEKLGMKIPEDEDE